MSRKKPDFNRPDIEQKYEIFTNSNFFFLNNDNFVYLYVVCLILTFGLWHLQHDFTTLIIKCFPTHPKTNRNISKTFEIYQKKKKRKKTTT